MKLNKNKRTKSLNDIRKDIYKDFDLTNIVETNRIFKPGKIYIPKPRVELYFKDDEDDVLSENEES